MPATCASRLAQLSVQSAQVHLFDIDIPGKQTFRESDTLAPGQSLTVVDTDAGRLGIGICFDIRFQVLPSPHASVPAVVCTWLLSAGAWRAQEMAMIYAKQGVQLIVYPGELFWRTAARAGVLLVHAWH